MAPVLGPAPRLRAVRLAVHNLRVLSDPKKLRTQNGFGYLVSWRDRVRGLDDARARQLAQRLLDEPGNLEAIRSGVGRPSASKEELVEWLSSALAEGSMVALRTRRKPQTLERAEETDWRDLVDAGENEEAPPAVETTTLELLVRDELGQGVPGIPFRLTSGERAETDESGVARFEEVSSSFGHAVLDDRQGLREVLRGRWAERRSDAWVEVEPGPHLTVSGIADPLPEFGLQAGTPHHWVVQPRVERVRIVGNVFETNKAFVLPDALHLLQQVVSLYGTHDDASFVLVGHTDTSGEPELNGQLSVDRAKVVQAYLEDDVETWLGFYEHPVRSSQRWGEREDGLLLDRALQSLGLDPPSDRIRAYQDARGLSVDGDIGPESRRALIEDYMALDGSTAPQTIEMFASGEGEAFPLASDGETLDVDPLDGVDDPTDRRVEVYVFEPSLGVLPTPENPQAYLAWRERSQRTHDMLVVRTIAFAVRVVDTRSGAVLPGAKVSLDAVGLLGAGPGGTTDAFGVRSFFNVVAGAYHLQVEKDGFVSNSREHLIASDTFASVLEVGLEPRALLDFRVGVRDPLGDAVPLPKGARVRVEVEGGSIVEAEVGDEGAVTVELEQAEGVARLSLVLDGPSCLFEAPDGERRLATVQEALAESQSGARFIQLKEAFDLGGAFLTLDGHDGSDTFDISAFVERSVTAPVSLDISPVWEHVCFTFFCRHHRKFRTVPASTGSGEANLVMTGHPDGAATPAFRSAWPVERDGRTIHALAWFLDSGGFPLESDAVRMECPPKTYVATLRSAPERTRMRTVDPDSSFAKQVDEPHRDRLLFYDLPEAWHCDRYFAKRTGDDTKTPYLALARQTAASSPILVSLDDIVVMRAGTGAAKQPVPIEREFTIFDAAFDVYKPNERVPKDYGEPYFTDLERILSPPGRGDVPGFVLLDAAPDTRAVIHGDVFDVFDIRTTAEDGEVPVGARVAFSPFGEGAAEDAAGPASNFCWVERRYRSPNLEGPGGQLSEPSAKLCSAALFRCIDSEPAREHAMLLQYGFVLVDFSPKGKPPRGGQKIAKPPPPEKQRRLVAQSLHLAHAAWSGRALSGAGAVFEHEATKKRESPSDLPERTPTEFLSGDGGLRCHYRAYFFRGDELRVNLLIRVWGGKLRSRVSFAGTGDLRLRFLGIPKARSTLCHELGHMLGLPDEYVESRQFGSLEREGFESPGHVPGGVYDFDVPASDPGVGPGENRVVHHAMMVNDRQVRPRHIAMLMTPLLHRVGLQTGGGRWERGARSFVPMESVHDLPGGVPDLYKRQAAPFDVFLYLSGPGGFAEPRFHGGGEAVHGVLVLECRVALSFPDALEITEQKTAAKSVVKQLARVGRQLACWCRIRHLDEVFPVAVVLAPRFLGRTVPATRRAEARDDANEYLASVDGDRFVEIPPVLSDAEVATQRAELEAEVEKGKARILELEKELQALENEEGAQPVEILAKKDLIKVNEKLLKENQASLDALLTAPDPARTASLQAYGEFVARITKRSPPHLEVLLGSASEPTVGAAPLSVRLPIRPGRSEARDFRAAVLQGVGLPPKPTAAELSSVLENCFDGSAFEVVGVVKS